MCIEAEVAQLTDPEEKREFLEAFETLILKPRGLDYRMQFTGPTGTNVGDLQILLLP